MRVYILFYYDGNYDRDNLIGVFASEEAAADHMAEFGKWDQPLLHVEAYDVVEPDHA